MDENFFYVILKELFSINFYFKMINLKYFFCGLIAMFVLDSCINHEYLPNAEADILSATIDHADSLLATEPTISDFMVTFRLKDIPKDYHFSPRFTLTDGATISPQNGTVLDFSKPQTYVVTSENKQWQKKYIVDFLIDSPDFEYSFEQVETDSINRYHIFYSLNENQQKIYNWGSGNKGFSLTLSLSNAKKFPEAYPTYQINEGYKGKAAKLVTLSTGTLGASFGAPLASGNLFIGDFVEVNPSDPRIGLHFGRPYKSPTAPVALQGFYKYKAGDKFTVNKPPSSLTKDTWDAYALLFEKGNGEGYLRGDFSFEDPRIVGIARVNSDKYGETSEWTSFEAPFIFKEGKAFDSKKEYFYTIVFAASKEGNIFNGAVGSTLWIDEVKFITK